MRLAAVWVKATALPRRRCTDAGIDGGTNGRKTQSPAFTRTQRRHHHFNRASGIDCRVRNMSPAGACLEVASQIGIPDDFVLVVGYDKINQPCHVIWRADMRMGVEFRAA